MDMFEQIIRLQVEKIVNESADKYATIGLGKEFEFDSGGYRELQVPPEIKEKLIYQDITVHTDDFNILIIRDNHPIYGFHVDAEGAQATMEHDLGNTPDAVNYNMAVASRDVDEVTKMMSDLKFMARFQEQLVSGFKKGKENGHY